MKNIKKSVNQHLNKQIKDNFKRNFNKFQEEKYFAKVGGGKEMTHNIVFSYAEDEKTLANTARNYQFDLIRIQNQTNQQRLSYSHASFYVLLF